MDEKENTVNENQVEPDEAQLDSKKEDKFKGKGREPWLVGAILILIGLVFLLQNLTKFYLENWWALFIFIPAFRAFNGGWQGLRYVDGQLTAVIRGAFIKGLILTAVAVFFLFELDWIIFGPILLICAGFAMLMNAVLPK